MSYLFILAHTVSVDGVIFINKCAAILIENKFYPRNAVLNPCQINPTNQIPISEIEFPFALEESGSQRGSLKPAELRPAISSSRYLIYFNRKKQRRKQFDGNNFSKVDLFSRHEWRKLTALENRKFNQRQGINTKSFLMDTSNRRCGFWNWPTNNDACLLQKNQYSHWKAIVCRCKLAFYPSPLYVPLTNTSCKLITHLITII